MIRDEGRAPAASEKASRSPRQRAGNHQSNALDEINQTNGGRRRDPFEQYREECVYRITADRKLTGSEVRLGVIIAMHLNRESREAWPSENRLAKRAGLDRRNLHRDLKGGLLRHLEIIPGKRGRGHTTHYRFRPLVGEPVVSQAETTPEAKPEPAPPPEPRNAAEYERYLTTWLAACTNRSEIDDRWRRERDLRRECVVIEEFERVLAKKDARIDALLEDEEIPFD
jgi:hypothetical protein